MARISRAVLAGYPHRVLQRGNYSQTVFEEDADYRFYLNLLGECMSKFGLTVWAYCLMSDHVHYVCVPKAADSLARTLNTLHMRYSQYFNDKKGRRGHLWQGRFYSCILDERHALAAMRYDENNPVRRGLVDDAPAYPWSSARSHVCFEPNPILAGECYLLNEIADWKAFLAGKADDRLIHDLHECMKTGRPCGDNGFVRMIEDLLHRKLRPAPRGRPKKYLLGNIKG